MQPYRIYQLTPDGQFAGPPRDVVLHDDEEARRVAREMMPPDAQAEIWQGTRRVS